MKPIAICRLLLLVICLATGTLSARADPAPPARAGDFLKAIDRHDTATVGRLLHEDPSLANLKLDRGRTPLFAAIDGNADGPAAALLMAGADANARDNSGNTPLTEEISSFGQDLVILSLLLAHGANVNAPGLHGFTPLRVSVEPNDRQASSVGFALAKSLLKKGASYGNPFLDAIAHDDVAALNKLAHASPRLVNQRLLGVTPLDQAVFWQNVVAAKWLLQHGADVNAKNDRGETPLIHALAETEEDGGDRGLISLLITHHAQVNIPDQSGQTPLAIAANMFFLDKKTSDLLFGLLLTHGANVNATDSNGGNVLMSLTASGTYSFYRNAAQFLRDHGASYRSGFLDAIAQGDVAAVKAMLAKRPTLATTTDDFGNSAVVIAAFWDQKPLLSALLSHGASLNAKGLQGSTVLIKALENGDGAMAAFLLSKGANANVSTDYGVTPLTLAIQQSVNDKQGLRLVSLLLAHGANPRFAAKGSQQNALGAAVFDDAVGAVEMLLQKGVNINDGGNPDETPLHEAVRNRSHQISRLLRQHGARYGSSPLIEAVTQGDLARIQELVKADPKAINTPVNGETPLSAALYWGDKETVSLLLDLGADPNGELSRSGPALNDLAETQGNDPAPQEDDLAALLVTKGADVNRVEEDMPPGHQTPLSTAVYWGNTRLMALLLKDGAHVDVRDIQDRTPLFYAVGRGDKDMVALLLDNHAAINAKDGEGETPLHVALQDAAESSETIADKTRYGAVADLLRQRGGTE